VKRPGFFSLIKTALQRGLVARSALETNLFPPLALPIVFRPYRNEDYDVCLAIYRKNEPVRFPPGHVATFERFLKDEKKTCIVAELDSTVVAFGGLTLYAPDLAVLYYGLVSPEFQGLRIGSTLTLLRIAQMGPHPADTFILIFAVEPSMPFYRRFGFALAGTWKAENGKDYPIGLLRVTYHEMQRLKVALEQRGIRVRGDLVLHPSSDMTGEVVYGPNGPQFMFQRRDAPTE